MQFAALLRSEANKYNALVGQDDFCREYRRVLLEAARSGKRSHTFCTGRTDGSNTTSVTYRLIDWARRNGLTPSQPIERTQAGVGQHGLLAGICYKIVEVTVSW